MSDTEILRANIDCLASLITVLKNHDVLLLLLEREYHPDLTEAEKSLQHAKDVYVRITNTSPWS